MESGNELKALRWSLGMKLHGMEPGNEILECNLGMGSGVWNLRMRCCRVVPGNEVLWSGVVE